MIHLYKTLACLHSVTEVLIYPSQCTLNITGPQVLSGFIKSYWCWVFKNFGIESGPAEISSDQLKSEIHALGSNDQFIILVIGKDCTQNYI